MKKLAGFLAACLLVLVGSQIPTLAQTFTIGSTVEVYNTGGIGLRVRNAPCGDRIGNEPDGSIGVILEGPIYCVLEGTGYYWWRIRWSDGLEGWSAQNWLKIVEQPPQPPPPPIVEQPPYISGVSPAQPLAQPSRQWLTVLGSGFVPESQVILSIGGSFHLIPPDRTRFVSSTQIDVYVGLTEPGTWTIQVVNPGGRYSDPFSFQVIPTQQWADPPTLASPPHEATVSFTPTFEWYSVPNADYYGLYISEPPYGPSHLVYENEMVYGTSFTLPSGILREGVRYCWNMASHSSAGWSYDRTDGGRRFSDLWCFIVQPQVGQLPDLVVDNIVTMPYPPVASDYSTIRITIRNQGRRDVTATFFLHFYFDDTYFGRASIDGLAAGAAYTAEWRAVLWPSDTNLHMLRGVVDPDNHIAEVEEANNELSMTFRGTEPPRQTGTLYLETTPGEAAVYVDGQYKGTTPSTGYLEIKDLMVGDHTIEVRKPGYKEWIGTVTVPPGRATYKAVFLEAEQDIIGTIEIQATLNGQPWSGPVNYRLTGPQTVDGTSVPATFSNIPTGSYTLSLLSGGPRGAALTSITPSATQTLSAGGTITFTLNFSVTSPQNPVLEVAPPSLNFGNVMVGQCSDQSFEVRNSGGGTLSGTATTSLPFSIISGGSFSLGANQSAQVTVRFCPTVAGQANGTVSFSSNGGNISRSVSGVGITQPPLQPIRLRAPWTPGQYWVAQTYDTHTKEGWKFAVDFHYATPQAPGVIGRNSEGGRGQPVRAAHAGKVETKRIGFDCFGRWVEQTDLIITDDADPKLQTYYAHLIITVENNKKVEAGDIIGYVSDLGCASAPHLHFQVMYAGQWVPLDDPNRLLLDGEVILSGPRVDPPRYTEKNGYIYDYTAMPRSGALKIGDRVRVINGPDQGRIRVRRCASSDDARCPIIAYKPNGATGTIIEGPILNDITWVWHNIRWDDDQIEGWSAQGDSVAMWLEKVTGPLPRFSLTVTKAGTGNGTVISSPTGIDCGTTCSAQFDSGTSVTLTATPAAGSTFAGWSGCDSTSGNQCTITMMNKNRTVVAIFNSSQMPQLSCGSRPPLSKEELANLVIRYFPDGIVPQTGESIRVTAYAIAMAESGGNPTACGPKGEIGLWQITMGAFVDLVRRGFYPPDYKFVYMFDPDENAKAARELSSGGTDWNLWCTWEKTACGNQGNLKYRDYLDEARRVLDKVIPPPAQDSDRDGIPDSQDQCPYDFGPPYNNGCPASKGKSIEEALDLNRNYFIDDDEILQALKYWFKGEPVPDTNGKVIDDQKLRQLVDIWLNRRPITPSSEASSPKETTLNIKGITLSSSPVRHSQVRFKVDGTGIRGIKVQIFDLAGHPVYESDFISGNVFEWRLQTKEGQPLANGVYLYVVRVRGFDGQEYVSEVRKLVILR
jgi:hypothetical protein